MDWEYHCKVFLLVNNHIVSVLHSAVKLTEANFNCGKITAQAGSGSIIHKILFYWQNKKKRETRFTESWNHPSRIPKITRFRQYMASVHFLERDPKRLLHEAVRK